MCPFKYDMMARTLLNLTHEEKIKIFNFIEYIYADCIGAFRDRLLDDKTWRYLEKASYELDIIYYDLRNEIMKSHFKNLIENE